jgi:putative protease
MATRTKVKSKNKRKKRFVTEAPPRRKTAATRKPNTIRKKVAQKQSQRVSPKKSRQTLKVAVKPRPVTAPPLPEAAKPTPSQAVQPVPSEERIGFVIHYYGHPSVASLRLEAGTLRVGDVIHIRGHTTDFSQKIESLEVNHVAVTEVGPSDDFGLKVAEHVREHDVVYKVR